MSDKPDISLSLNSFIKIYAMDMHLQMAEVNRRVQQNGGYDFYRILNSAIRAFIEGRTRDEIDYILNSSSRPQEISYNKMAFEAFEERFGKKIKKLSTFDKKGKILLADKKVEISVYPNFLMETNDGIEVYNVWAMQSPAMSAHMGSIGCYLAKEAFRKTSSNYKFKFFDAVGKKVYSNILNSTPELVNRMASNIAHWASNC